MKNMERVANYADHLDQRGPDTPQGPSGFRHNGKYATGSPHSHPNLNLDSI